MDGRFSVAAVSWNKWRSMVLCWHQAVIMVFIWEEGWLPWEPVSHEWQYFGGWKYRLWNQNACFNILLRHFVVLRPWEFYLWLSFLTYKMTFPFSVENAPLWGWNQFCLCDGKEDLACTALPAKCKGSSSAFLKTIHCCCSRAFLSPMCFWVTQDLLIPLGKAGGLYLE